MNAFEESLIPYFGKERLKKIQAVHVGIAGLGGLGSNVAAALVRCGFRRLTLCDFDKVETSNLNRQWYFLDQVGKHKTEALRENLLRINPDLELGFFKERINLSNADGVFSQCDAVVEAFDKAADKRMLMDVFLNTGKFFVSASGLAGWGDADSIVSRRIKESVFLVGDSRRGVSQDVPPCAPRVLVSAAKQADLLLSWVLG